MKVVFVGLGNMGWPMAANVVRGGFGVVGVDIDASRAQEWADVHGAEWAEDPAAAAGAADVVVTMLPTGREVRDVVLGSMGPGLRPGTVVIDMSSSDPVGTRSLAAELAPIGVTLVDAPVSGGVPRATDGTLAIMIGGDDGAIATAEPVLACMGDRRFRVGGSGNGHAMKALNNLVAGTAFVVASEAMLVGERFGLDPQVMIDVMNVSTARCFNTEMVMSQQVISGRFASGFALGLLAKDVGIAADLATAIGTTTPLAALVSELLAEARDEIGAAEDHTRAYEHWAARDS